MRTKLIRDASGMAYAAEVTLTVREQAIVRAGRVPLIYGPGGMGPVRPMLRQATVRFGGACFVDVEDKLRACLAAFRSALTAEIARQNDAEKNREAEKRGFQDYPMGAVMDAQRGTKGWPDMPDCPFRNPAKAAAWQRGFDAAHAEVV